MNTQKLTIAEAKQKLNNGFGSIYSKEDVINLLDSISVEEKSSIDVEKIKEFVQESIEDWFNNMSANDYIDHDSIEFSINYGNTLSVDDIQMDNRQMSRDIYQQVSYSIEECIEECKREQQELKINQAVSSEPIIDTEEDNEAE